MNSIAVITGANGYIILPNHILIVNFITLVKLLNFYKDACSS